ARPCGHMASPLTFDELVSGLGMTGVHVGTAGGDALTRSEGSGLQVYVGGAGNDTFTTGGGQDVYVFGRGFGQDTIFDSAFGEPGDRIRLALYTADDVTIHRDGVDLVIAVKGTTDTITVKNQYEEPFFLLGGIPASANHAIEEIQFADGTIYDAGDMAAAIGL